MLIVKEIFKFKLKNIFILLINKYYLTSSLCLNSITLFLSIFVIQICKGCTFSVNLFFPYCFKPRKWQISNINRITNIEAKNSQFILLLVFMLSITIFHKNIHIFLLISFRVDYNNTGICNLVQLWIKKNSLYVKRDMVYLTMQLKLFEAYQK